MEIPARAKHKFLTNRGLTVDRLASIGAIAVLASHCEFYAEQAVWSIDAIPVQGTRPRTDAKPISELIRLLADFEEGKLKVGLTPLVAQWCKSADLCFSCRNSLMHGSTMYMDGEFTTFARNVPTQGAKRKREFRDFYASQNTLNLLEQAFEYLLHGIYVIWTESEKPDALGDISKIMRGLREAWSIAAELDNLAAAVNHEKY
ncbi:hypothetical protein [Tabrizicola sp.]|uniref:hypothetical protein n=1 Tax=Tabrizicola sp. TaxID=2005166 RepID=UPI002733F28C|nr:hypothetical protein [Tabrizicola sp.]MDP3196132.1 hypothetical protein [Tabrizicola sp.]